jgi:tRNA threonylcarbamoyladenosine biosynthesis protein TsaE
MELVIDPATLVLRTEAADQTKTLARAIAPLCEPGDVLLLVGDLGAGKTIFAQGFGAALGITEAITSPTFTLVRQYAVQGPAASSRVGPVDRAGDVDGHRSRVRTLVHADVYRLDRLHEIADLGLGELVDDDGVALVEWGDVAEPILGGSLAITLVAAVDHDDHRLITVRSVGTAWSSRWAALQSALSPWQTAQ